MSDPGTNRHDRPDPYSEAPVLVLGASGFIGRRVARSLMGRGARTFLGVRNQKRARATLEPLGDRAEWVDIDLRDPPSLAQAIQRIQPAITFNLAAYGIDPSERDPEVARLINSDAVVSLCEATARAPKPDWLGQAIVHVGSAAEYGPARGRISENSPTSPTSVYGKSKLAGTRRLRGTAIRLGTKALTARLFMVYGPGEGPYRLLPSLLAAAGKDQALDLTRGQEARDFTYVADVASGLLRLGLVEASAGEVVNLATGTLTTVRQFAEKAADIVGMSRGNLRFGMREPGSHQLSHGPVSIARLQELVAWSPSTTVEEGIQRTIQELRSGPASAVS